jgi:hypothetical protein
MNKTNTLLGQLLEMVPRSRFNQLVKDYNTEKGEKGFTSWAHFVTMIFAQLSGQSGLRSIEDGINQQQSSLYHLGIIRNVKRSTIAYANEKRDAALYEGLFYALLEHVPKGQSHGFRFKNPLYSIDATTIDLCLKLFPWANFREAKAGIKVSVKLDHRGKIPCFAVISNAREHESQEVEKIPLQSGDIVTFDRGYNNYKYFAKLCLKSIYFVTRLKENASYTVVSTNKIGNNKNVLSDEFILLDGFYAQKDCPFYLRKIVSLDPKTKKTIEILTNQMTWAASTICAVYRDRWQIELFFKAIKQNLKIKRFYGTSRNAVYTQIWIALIAYLLFSILKFSTNARRTFTCFSSVFPTVLFQRRSLRDWFTDTSQPVGYCKPQAFGQLELI